MFVSGLEISNLELIELTDFVRTSDRPEIPGVEGLWHLSRSGLDVAMANWDYGRDRSRGELFPLWASRRRCIWNGTKPSRSAPGNCEQVRVEHNTDACFHRRDERIQVCRRCEHCGAGPQRHQKL